MQLLCRNRVTDYREWRLVFDSHAPAQREAGLRLIHLWREVGDPENVFFLFEVDDEQRARAFLDDPAAAEAGRASGVLDGDYHFLDAGTSDR